MATTATKVCRLCNTDCAERPRVKDELGRYTCQACLDKEMARAASRAAPASQRDDDGLAAIRAAAMMEAKSAELDLPETQSCAKCHGYMPPENRICLRCGFDRKRGAKVMTRIE